MTVAVAIVMTTPRGPAAAPSFQDVATAHLDAVHRYLTQMVRDAHLAEDLTSETFERAFRRWRQFDPARGGALTWLIAIARTVALDHLRGERRRRAREERYAATAPAVADPGQPAGELPGDLRAALATLTDTEREVVALRVLLDVDGPTTARLTGLSPTACSSHLHRAMTKLRRELGR